MFRGIRQNISVQKVGAETLVYDESRHKAFCLNASSAAVWELANGERSVDELATLAGSALGAPVSEDLVLFILQELRNEGLVEPALPLGAEEAVSRRDLLRKLGAGCAALLPIIASIAAPTAAQAYSGCVDCSVAPGRSVPRSRRGPG